MSKKPKKVSTTLNHIKYFIILSSTITGCISISAFAYLIGILIANYEFCKRVKNLCNNYKN